MLNITLVAQAVAFFVAYFILTHLVWRPATAQVQAEDAQQMLLEQQVARAVQDVHFKTTEYDRNWYRLRHELQAHKPLPSMHMLFARRMLMPAIKPQQYNVDQLVQDAKVAIMKQVSDESSL